MTESKCLSKYFQTKEILSLDAFRRFWVDVKEEQTGLTFSVGAGEAEASLLSRTWLLGTEPQPWSDIRYIGFTTWGNQRMEYKIIYPSKIFE